MCGEVGVKFKFRTTTTGRHCCLGGLGEQFDLWQEGQVSEFSTYGPGVTNYFKFMKWCFWLFVTLTIIALPALVLNTSGSFEGTIKQTYFTIFSPFNPYFCLLMRFQAIRV